MLRLSAVLSKCQPEYHSLFSARLPITFKPRFIFVCRKWSSFLRLIHCLKYERDLFKPSITNYIICIFAAFQIWPNAV